MKDLYYLKTNRTGYTIIGPKGVVCITEAASLNELKDLLYYANKGIVVINEEQQAADTK